MSACTAAADLSALVAARVATGSRPAVVVLDEQWTQARRDVHRNDYTNAERLALTLLDHPDEQVRTDAAALLAAACKGDR